MKRKEYLELCRQNALIPKSVRMYYHGIIYYPFAFQMSFDKLGATINTAILKDTRANCIVSANLDEIEIV